MSLARAIIVVEDDSGMCQALGRLLEAAGWTARTYGSAEELLETKGAAGAEAFVFDIHLPGIDGFELYERLATAGLKAPVIFVTAHDRTWMRPQAERLGAVGYFIKPFPGRELIDTLNQHCHTA